MFLKTDTDKREAKKIFTDKQISRGMCQNDEKYKHKDIRHSVYTKASIYKE